MMMMGAAVEVDFKVMQLLPNSETVQSEEGSGQNAGLNLVVHVPDTR